MVDYFTIAAAIAEWMQRGTPKAGSWAANRSLRGSTVCRWIFSGDTAKALRMGDRSGK